MVGDKRALGHLWLRNMSTFKGKVYSVQIDPDEIPETCSLDVADAGPSLHSEIAPLLGITRQAVHQIEQHALTKLARPGRGARRLLGDHDGT